MHVNRLKTFIAVQLASSISVRKASLRSWLSFRESMPIYACCSAEYAVEQVSASEGSYTAAMYMVSCPSKREESTTLFLSSISPPLAHWIYRTR